MDIERIVVVGASAGGVEPLRRIAAALPEGLPAAVVVVLHMRADAFSALPAILGRAGSLPAIHPRDGEPLRPGCVFVSPPDVHMVIRPGEIHLVHGPSENGHRPAIDPLFRTAAESYGAHVIGVVLSGVLDDGTAGLAAIKRAGGITVVQSPDDALYSAMPQNALRRVDIDFVVPSADLGALLVGLVRAGHPDPIDDPPSARRDPPEDAIEQALDLGGSPLGQARGSASGLSCPDCSGALWEVREGGITKFRCRVGHAWTEAALLVEQRSVLEVALWTALRVLGERADLVRQIHEHALERGHYQAARLFGDRLEEIDHDVGVLRAVVARPELTALDERLTELTQGVAPHHPRLGIADPPQEPEGAQEAEAAEAAGDSAESG